MGLDEDYSNQPSTTGDANKELIGAIHTLNKSINHLLKLFEDANQEIIDQYHDNTVPAKEKLEEISDQNEKIAEGLVGLADMLGNKTTSMPAQDVSTPNISSQAPAEGLSLDANMPELEQPPKHDFDMGFNDNELKEVPFSNQGGMSPKLAEPKLDGPVGLPPINKVATAPIENVPGFGEPDPFAGQDPFAQASGQSPQADATGFPPDAGFEPPQMPGAPSEFPMTPDQGQFPQTSMPEFPAPPGMTSNQPVGQPQDPAFGVPPGQPPSMQPNQSLDQPLSQPPGQPLGMMPNQPMGAPGQSTMQNPFPQAPGGMPGQDMGLDSPPAVPEPPKKKGLFSMLKK